MKNWVNRNAESFLLWRAAHDPHGNHLVDVKDTLNIGYSKLE